jgi:hypothetical protein
MAYHRIQRQTLDMNLVKAFLKGAFSYYAPFLESEQEDDGSQP